MQVGGQLDIITTITIPIREAYTQFDFFISENLYGYSFNNLTTSLALIVLFLYEGTVLIHILVTQITQISFKTREIRLNLLL